MNFLHLPNESHCGGRGGRRGGRGGRRGGRGDHECGLGMCSGECDGLCFVCGEACHDCNDREACHDPCNHDNNIDYPDLKLSTADFIGKWKELYQSHVRDQYQATDQSSLTTIVKLLCDTYEPVESIVEKHNITFGEILINVNYGGFSLPTGVKELLSIIDETIDPYMYDCHNNRTCPKLIYAFKTFKKLSNKMKNRIHEIYAENKSSHKPMYRYDCDNSIECFSCVSGIGIPFNISEYDGRESYSVHFDKLFTICVNKILDAKISSDRKVESIAAIKQIINKYNIAVIDLDSACKSVWSINKNLE